MQAQATASHPVACMISRTERDELHSLCRLSLSGADDLSLCVDNGDIDGALYIREKLETVTHLLDDIGWHPFDRRAEFQLVQDPDRLAAFIRHHLEGIDELLEAEAVALRDGPEPGEVERSGCGDEAEWREQCQAQADAYLDERAACMTILGKIDAGRRP